jgi:hypothetical protein
VTSHVPVPCLHHDHRTGAAGAAGAPAALSPGWSARAGINAVGAVLTLATTFIELVSKFTEGAWLIVLVIPALVLLFNQRGVILERAIRRGTANVVLCRLRYRLEHFTPGPAGPADSAEPAPQDRRADGGGRADGPDQSQAGVLGDGGEDLVGHPEQPPER